MKKHKWECKSIPIYEKFPIMFCTTLACTIQMMIFNITAIVETNHTIKSRFQNEKFEACKQNILELRLDVTLQKNSKQRVKIYKPHKLSNIFWKNPWILHLFPWCVSNFGYLLLIFAIVGMHCFGVFVHQNSPPFLERSYNKLFYPLKRREIWLKQPCGERTW